LCYLEFRDEKLLNLHHNNTSLHQNYLINNNIGSTNQNFISDEKVKKRASECIIKKSKKSVKFISDTNNSFLKSNRHKRRNLLKNIYER
jgi:hypothetical protein